MPRQYFEKVSSDLALFYGSDTKNAWRVIEGTVNNALGKKVWTKTVSGGKPCAVCHFMI